MAACTVGTTTYYLEAVKDRNDPTTANPTTLNVCIATKILDRLHREFTEEYVPVPGTGQQVATGRTAISTNVSANPTFYLRKQPKLNNFQGEGTDANGINRLNSYLRSVGSDHQYYRSAVYAVMNGVYEAGINAAGYRNELTTPPRDLTTENADNFKGIYGLKKLNEVIEQKIADIVRSNSVSTSGSKLLSDAQHYDARHGIKTTLEEIARRENEIYREKFLHIILMLVGIFLVSTQLVKKYFSFGDGGGGGGGSGFGFGSSNLFTGFGLGSGSGLFSRFGGLGLGRSGRSRITSMFSSNPYSLSNR
jgi:hypothetical protein